MTGHFDMLLHDDVLTILDKNSYNLQFKVVNIFTAACFGKKMQRLKLKL